MLNSSMELSRKSAAPNLTKNTVIIAETTWSIPGWIGNRHPCIGDSSTGHISRLGSLQPKWRVFEYQTIFRLDSVPYTYTVTCTSVRATHSWDQIPQLLGSSKENIRSRFSLLDFGIIAGLYDVHKFQQFRMKFQFFLNRDTLRWRCDSNFVSWTKINLSSNRNMCEILYQLLWDFWLGSGLQASGALMGSIRASFRDTSRRTKAQDNFIRHKNLKV